MTNKLYKYRGISNFRYFVDIILKNRLYAAKYTELKDPMEGRYEHLPGDLSREILQKLKTKKLNYRICSLSRSKDNRVMWTHYAEGHKGVVIELEIDNSKFTHERVEYDGSPFITSENINSKTAKDILCNKDQDWVYEEEDRVFSNKKYIDIRILRIFTGISMLNKDYLFIEKLLLKINPDIEIVKAQTYMNLANLNELVR